MITVVGSFTVHKFSVVLHESQRRIHLLIGQWPVPMLIVQIVTATLQKNPQWLGIGFAKHRFCVHIQQAVLLGTREYLLCGFVLNVHAAVPPNSVSKVSA